MESNTFSTSAFIATDEQKAYAYLGNLKNLDEWTLGSRMQEQIDPDTWIGTASGYQRPLAYHVRRLEGARFLGIEWQCGYEPHKYFKSYPAFVFPLSYIEPGTTEEGVYLHWVSVIDPVQRTQMIMDGISTVHNSEIRALKAALERREGLTKAATGRFRIATDSIYVDAPIETSAAWLADVRNVAQWSHLLKPSGAAAADFGRFHDEYNQDVEITARASEAGDDWIVEQDFAYPAHRMVQRAPLLLIPCAHAFGDPTATGFILHRITFWDTTNPPTQGKLSIDDYGAEHMNIKRLLELAAGNLETFGRGRSYIPAAKR
jgi:hypothetical protein